MLAPRSGPEFTIFGNVVTVRTPWAIAAVVALFLTAVELAPHPLTDINAVQWYLNAAFLVTAALGSILIHEAAHAAVAQRIGRSAERISVYPLGGVADNFHAPGTPREETLIAIAGPVVSVFGAGLLFAGWMLTPNSVGPLRNDLMFLLAVNVTLGVMNLLPGYPLDGGRIFRALVWYLHDDFTAGTRASVAYGQVISTFALASGLVILGSRTRWSLAGIWIIMAAWAVARVGRQEMTRSRFLSIGATLTAGDAVRGLNAHVRADQALDEVLEALLAEMNSGPGLVIDQGEVIGVIALQQLRKYRRADWPKFTAQDAMIPIRQMPAIDESAPVRKLLQELSEGSADTLIVVGKDGVTGALDRHIAIEKLAERVQAAKEMG